MSSCLSRLKVLLIPGWWWLVTYPFAMRGAAVHDHLALRAPGGGGFATNRANVLWDERVVQFSVFSHFYKQIIERPA